LYQQLPTTGEKMAYSMKTCGRNSHHGFCRYCGKPLAPGQGLIWKFRGHWMVRCAPGVGCKAGQRPLAPEPVAATVSAVVDVQKADGTVTTGYLLADGSLVTLRWFGCIAS
jgi:hypothetical protein